MAATPVKPDLISIASRFRLRGRPTLAEPYGTGHVNDTYAVTCEQDGQSIRYILQRINHLVFRDPPAMMENIVRVTRHVRGKLEEEGADEIDRRVLEVIPTLDGVDFLHDEEGLYWRVYQFIERAQTYDVIENTRQAYQAAMAFGRFQQQLADLPGPRLTESVPAFHHTRSRMDTLLKAIEADVGNRAASARAEIEFALRREPMAGQLLDGLARGALPERITHNDTKLNNVMIDDRTSEGVCVIDLDTVMPGSSLYDFGDMVRTATNTGAEDETDLSKISSDLTMFEALVKGYLAATRDFLTPAELDLLPLGGKLMTFEVGIRFLADYLEGDVYFKTHRKNHNLDRCRTQFALVQSIEEQEERMHELIASCR
jgi:Ser/Thr protein kinase RdoA (MazF antagonist)